jgi:hypothetical protein
MQYAKFTATRSRLIPLGALMLATAVGGCVAYAGYPTGTYSYNYPSSYYAGYPRTYTYPSNSRPFYSPNYYSSPTSYEGNGGSGDGR